MLVYMAETPSRTLKNISFHFSRSELSEVNLNLPQKDVVLANALRTMMVSSTVLRSNLSLENTIIR